SRHIACLGALLSLALSACEVKAGPEKPPARTRIGINLSGLSYWTTEHPFSNLARHASRWRAQKIGEPFSWDYPLPAMTPDGYPKTIPQGQYLESFLVGTDHREHLPDELIVL